MSDCQKANAAQVTAVIKEYGGFVWRVLRRQGVEEGLLEDASQEVFLAVFRKLSEFEGRSKLSTWLFRICVHVAEHTRRSHRRTRELLTADPPEPAIAAEQCDQIAEKQLRERLEKALAEIDQDKRDVFVLFEVEGLSMAEVAEAVGCPVATAYSRLYAARERIESSLRTVEQQDKRLDLVGGL